MLAVFYYFYIDVQPIQSAIFKLCRELQIKRYCLWVYVSLISVDPRSEQVMIAEIEKSSSWDRFLGRNYSSEIYISPLENEKKDVRLLQCAWNGAS